MPNTSPKLTATLVENRKYRIGARPDRRSEPCREFRGILGSLRPTRASRFQEILKISSIRRLPQLGEERPKLPSLIVKPS
jgi:hypothetical protein